MKRRDRNAGRTVSIESAERLLSALVGVAGVSITPAPDGSIRSVQIRPEPGASERQVALNVTSALLAGLGITIDAAVVSVGSPEAAAEDQDQEPETEPAREEPPAPSAEAPVPPQPPAADREEREDEREDARVTPLPGTRAGAQPSPRTLMVAAGKQIAHAAGSFALAAAPRALPDEWAAPPLGVERVETWSRHDRLICRVVLAGDGERFTAIADTADLPGARLELAARATADALRYARRPSAPFQMEGTGTAEVGGRTHVVVSLRIWNGTDFDAAPGAAVVHDTIEEAAARAVLHAIHTRFD